MTKLAVIINEVYRDIGLANPNWWWLRKFSVVNTVADVTSGTLAATNGSTTITFSPGGPEEMDRVKSYAQSVGKPLLWTIRDFATTGDPTTARQLIVHPYPDATYRLDVNYTQSLNTELSGTTRPPIPDDFAQILIYGTLSRAYPIMMGDAAANRGLYYAGLFNAGLEKMIATQRGYEDLPSTTPLDVYRRFYHRGRRQGALRSLFGRYP